jgi:hypothetical protein
MNPHAPPPMYLQVRHLVLQPGVSHSCFKGMVSSHVCDGPLWWWWWW